MINIKKIIKDCIIAYDIIGNGKPLVLLHGWGSNRFTFNNIIKELKDNYKIYNIDLPGFGESEIGLPLDLYETTDCLIELFKELNIYKPIIIGHSYGGRIAIILSSIIEVSKLVLISSAGIKQKLSINKKLKVKLYKLIRHYKINIKMGSQDYVNCDNVRRIMLVKAVNTDLSLEMSKIKCPTILIYGDNDTITKKSISKEINEKIKGSFLFYIDNCSHFPYIESPTTFLLILNSFLSGE